METTVGPEVCVDHQRGIVDGILRGMRRRGLPANVDVDDLRQEGILAVFLSGIKGPDALTARVARNAMIDHLRGKLRENKTFTALDDSTDSGKSGRASEAVRKRRVWKDPFFFLAVEAIQQGYEEWNLERAERWA
jgi:DNA-directed RNA polymerase specialized sigma24 family protein